MTDFTAQQFNEAMASIDPEIELLEWEIINSAFRARKMTPLGYTVFRWNPYSDLNQLMPIVWKHGIDLDQELDLNLYGTWSAKGYINREWVMARALDIINDDPVEAIRQCLWQIYKEQK